MTTLECLVVAARKIHVTSWDVVQPAGLKRIYFCYWSVWLRVDMILFIVFNNWNLAELWTLFSVVHPVQFFHFIAFERHRNGTVLFTLGHETAKIIHFKKSLNLIYVSIECHRGLHSPKQQRQHLVRIILRVSASSLATFRPPEKLVVTLPSCVQLRHVFKPMIFYPPYLLWLLYQIKVFIYR